MLKYHKKIGFTLAEVLITLLVIGVVASLVIPSIIQDAQDAELHASWKKVFSDISQSTISIVSDNGGNLLNLCTIDGTQHDCFKNKYLTYLSITKSCNTGQTLGNCWHNNGNWKRLSGSTYTGWIDPAGIVLNNGALLYFRYQSSNCSFNDGSVLFCGDIEVDVNGFKGPNTVGKDIYGIYVQQNTIKPAGTQGDTNGSNCISTGTGWGCGAKYLYQ
jgi:prepilin-type N-terminal cleavage/methylation domain-containing protein